MFRRRVSFVVRYDPLIERWSALGVHGVAPIVCVTWQVHYLAPIVLLGVCLELHLGHRSHSADGLRFSSQFPDW